MASALPEDGAPAPEYRRPLSEALAWLEQHAHPEDRARVAAELSEAAQARRPYQLVYRLGPEPWSWVNDSGETAADGDPVVTGRVRKIAELAWESAESAAKVTELRWMLEHAGDAAVYRGN
jgi:hypothetical protein